MASEESGYIGSASAQHKIESDSDDEFFDALVADDDSAITDETIKEQQFLTKDENDTAKIIDEVFQSQTPESIKNTAIDNFVTERDALRKDENTSDDGLSSSHSEDEQQRHFEHNEEHPNRTGDKTKALNDDVSHEEGLRVEEEEEQKEDNEDDNGGFVSDEETKKELEEQMTEEDKEAQRAEAQTHKTNGNELFKTGEFADAVYAYSQALQLCPLCYKKDRSIMYANRAACKVRQERFESVIKDCNKALELNPVYLKVVLRRAQTYELMDKLEDALKDFQRALELDPGCYEARAACMRLPDQIKARNEKLKAEMMSKLKELGNLCLRPFGLSTDNFQLNQDPTSGSYSVNFSQNPGKN